jgi:hypothetical protein
MPGVFRRFKSWLVKSPRLSPSAAVLPALVAYTMMRRLAAYHLQSPAPQVCLVAYIHVHARDQSLKRSFHMSLAPFTGLFSRVIEVYAPFPITSAFFPALQAVRRTEPRRKLFHYPVSPFYHWIQA